MLVRGEFLDQPEPHCGSTFSCAWEADELASKRDWDAIKREDSRVRCSPALPHVTRRLIEHFTHQPAADHASEQLVTALTTRESELLLDVARGLTNAEIAQTRHISLSTTKTHVGNLLLTKLDARERVQLTITAYEAGLMRR